MLFFYLFVIFGCWWCLYICLFVFVFVMLSFRFVLRCFFFNWDCPFSPKTMLLENCVLRLLLTLLTIPDASFILYCTISLSTIIHNHHYHHRHHTRPQKHHRRYFLVRYYWQTDSYPLHLGRLYEQINWTHRWKKSKTLMTRHQTDPRKMIVLSSTDQSGFRVTHFF